MKLLDVRCLRALFSGHIGTEDLDVRNSLLVKPSLEVDQQVSRPIA
jgi:hypothetical protein